MKLLSGALLPVGVAVVFWKEAAAQVFSKYTDSNGIDFWQATFSTQIGKGDAQWGLALPPASDTALKDEYIGRLVVPRTNDGTWMGLSHMSQMTNSLLLVTWIDNSEVVTSFRYASGYVAPDIYTGNATLSQISHSVNDTHYEVVYRCEKCWKWDQDGATGSQVPATTADAAQLIGWAQATNAPTDPNEPDSQIQQHAQDGIFGALVASARNSKYTSWTSLATQTPSATTAPYGNSTGTGPGATGTRTGTAPISTSTVTSAPCPKSNILANTTWDYIVVGAGAGGIPIADRLSESGASVLLIEKGPPSSGRWGGTMKPDWLVGTNLTRFDVPGLDNEIWANSTGIACSDYSVMAGCVLGGGTAVNAGLWWRANPTDFDYNFPVGWKAKDMALSVERVFERNPFTDTPSTNGILYKPCGWDIVGGALNLAGWEQVIADDFPAKKNWTYSHPDEMFIHGERGGPMATYLVTAHARRNFKLITNTTVDRIIRDGSHIIGVELSAFLLGGQCGTVKVTPNTGKVILSAGAFGTPKILFRSGIGPQDQLEIAKAAEGNRMINASQWINLPVGYNLDDHTNTDVVITHPNVSFYNFYAAYNNPIKSDMDRYVDNRTGILTQSAPNLSVLFWEEIEGEDGITRQLQYTARVEGGHGITSDKAMVISQYLGRGATSRGRTTINAALDMTVSKVPYLNNRYDLAAVKSGLQNLIKSLSTDPHIKIRFPAPNITLDDFLDSYPRTTSERSANHWMGSCKMGLDSGLVKNGTSVVDTNTKVYGTDNLFVVDASIFPGMTSTNPSALIVAAAEHAAQLILGLGGRHNSTGLANSTTVLVPPYGSGPPHRPQKSSGLGPIGTIPFKFSRTTPCTPEVTATRKPVASMSSAGYSGSGIGCGISSFPFPSAPRATAPFLMSNGTTPSGRTAPAPSAASCATKPMEPVEINAI